MINKFNVLVFPCGSEIGLEIYRSLKFSTHINLFGASSIDDHGRFVYQNYIPELPFFENPNFISKLNEIIDHNKIDAVYPAMDGVIEKLTRNIDKINCRIIGSSQKTNEICLSKGKTYEQLQGIIKLPYVYSNLNKVTDFPVFMKPKIGYGSRGAKLIKSKVEGVQHLEEFSDCLILENLPGKEYTIDCFTNKDGKLLFSAGRERVRVSNGISVRTAPKMCITFKNSAAKINDHLSFRGAWFFQLKEDKNGELTLLEVASRLGGSSSIYRNLGVNFALLSIFDAFGLEVDLLYNDYYIEMDRALNNKYKIEIDYKNVYVDFDDCLLLTNKINTQLVSFIYQAINEKKKVILVTKHEKDIYETLREYRLLEAFDEIIHLKKNEKKFNIISEKKSIFIDDSFVERKEIFEKLQIPVFAPDAVESLLN